MLYRDLTKQIIGSFYEVYNDLGYGFLEKVYENAFRLDLQNKGFGVKQQHPISVRFQGVVVGEYFADLFINELIICEIKAVDKISKAHESQLINYLKATDARVGFVFNFGPKPDFVRKIFDSGRVVNIKKISGNPLN